MCGWVGVCVRVGVGDCACGLGWCVWVVFADHSVCAVACSTVCVRAARSVSTLSFLLRKGAVEGMITKSCLTPFPKGVIMPSPWGSTGGSRRFPSHHSCCLLF